MHCDKTSEKADNYMRHTDVCQSGVFWGTTWEVMANRSYRVAAAKKYGTDQWVQAGGSVRLVALRV